MACNLRTKVLESYKLLHKARKTVFNGDTYALNEARKKINEEYKKNKHVSDTSSIEELINQAKAVEQELRTCVIQLREKENQRGTYEAVITKETLKLDNVPFKCN